MNFFQSTHLCYFSQPIENRPVYQAVCRVKPATILEFGIQRGVRSVNLLELAARFHKPGEIQYCCIDPFEERTVEDGPGLSLRKAYKMLVKTGVSVRAFPGTPQSAFKMIAGNLDNVDLTVIATPSMDWTVEMKPRLLELMNERGIVFLGLSSPSGKPFVLKPLSVAEFRADAEPSRRAA